jgi:hypothetical protein
MPVELYCDHVDKANLWCQRNIDIFCCNFKDNVKLPATRMYFCKACYENKLEQLKEIISDGLDSNKQKIYIAEKEELLKKMKKDKEKLEEIERKIVTKHKIVT